MHANCAREFAVDVGHCCERIWTFVINLVIEHRIEALIEEILPQVRFISKPIRRFAVGLRYSRPMLHTFENPRDPVREAQ